MSVGMSWSSMSPSTSRSRPASIQLNGRDQSAGFEQTAGQDAESGPHLEHPVSGRGGREIQDRLEHVGIG